MNKITPLALLITGGFAGQASATTQYFDMGSSTEGTPITIGGAAAPQYIYQTTAKPVSGTPQWEFQTASASSYLTTLANASDMPTASSTYYQGRYKVGPVGDQVGLKFNIGANTYYGVARFNSIVSDALTFDGDTSNAEDPFSPRLGQIDYQLAGGVPEPESWALLIAGVGLAGVAMRRARRRSALVTA